MRIEYWGRIRVKNGSYYVTIPSGEVYKLTKHLFTNSPNELGGRIAGQEVLSLIHI